MGLDYSIMLFFERQDPWPIMEGVAQFADHNLKTHTAVRYPDKIIRLPFEPWAGTEEITPIPYDDQSKEWDFMTSLYFRKDQEVSDYANYYHLDEGPSQERVAIGYIYLTIYNNWEAYGASWDPDLILFQFMAATSHMSVLMADSPAICEPFIDLLEHYRGVYGLIDREMDAELIWLRGKEHQVIIPHAWMSLAEIEAYLDKGP